MNAADDGNKTERDGETPLDVAARQAFESTVQALIKSGTDVNKALGDDGRTVLFTATESGLDMIVQALIEADANINKARHNGETPLNIAAQKGSEAVVRC